LGFFSYLLMPIFVPKTLIEAGDFPNAADADTLAEVDLTAVVPMANQNRKGLPHGRSRRAQQEIGHAAFPRSGGRA
jgi:hypothetical protein